MIAVEESPYKLSTQVESFAIWSCTKSIAHGWFGLTATNVDLYCFGGGKGIRGPQRAGILVCRKDLIDTPLKLQSYGERRTKVLTNSNPSVVSAVEQDSDPEHEKSKNKLEIVSMTLQDGEDLIVGRSQLSTWLTANRR